MILVFSVISIMLALCTCFYAVWAHNIDLALTAALALIWAVVALIRDVNTTPEPKP